MIASNEFASFATRRNADKVLARIPQRAFGDTAWITLAIKSCAEHLAPAIASGKPHEIANAVRAIAHAPTLEQLDDVIGAACDAAISEAYAVRDTRMISNVASARSVIGTVISEIRERQERDVVAPAVIRETVDGYVKMVALLDKGMAERLDAVGNLAARIASTMHQSPAAILAIELAGRLHDLGSLALPGSARAADTLEQRNPVVGEAFIRSVPSLAHLAPIVRSHRERFDGTGYPDGLQGAEIPLASRIISVAAAFVDLVTDSPARAAVLPYDACHELSLSAGSRFDPEVVAATLHLLRVRQRTNRSA
jgi:HD-GYP domain-containing protein (c-di-GMP phosphodiesterase class II)